MATSLRIQQYLSVLTVLAVVGTLSWRIHYGVDFTDEGLSAVVPYRFALGDRPYFDEMNPSQTVGLLLRPLVQAWLQAHGGRVDGLFLFLRYCYLAFTLTIGAVVYWSSGERRERSLMLAGVAMAFVPFNLPDLNYNTVALGCFAAGAWLARSALQPPGRGGRALMAGLLHGLSIVAYPVLGAAVAVCGGALVWCEPQRWKTWVLAYGAGVGVAMAPLLVALGQTGSAQLLKVLHALEAGSAGQDVHSGGGLGRFGELLVAALVHLDPRVLVLLGISLVLAYRKPRQWVPVLLLLWPLWPLANTGFNALLYPNAYVAYGILLAWVPFFVRRERPESTMWRVVGLPALCAGLTMTYFSGNGLPGLAIGAFSLLLMGVWGSFEAGPFELLPAFLTVLVLLGFQMAEPYRDDALASLTTKVPAGPYRGLYTTTQKVEYIQYISDTLQSCQDDAHTVFFYDFFPAGYLMSGLRPLTNTAWTLPPAVSPGSDRESTVEYLRAHGGPDLIVHMKIVMFTTSHQFHERDEDSDPLRVYVQGPGFERVLESDVCDVYRRQAGGPRRVP